MKMNSMHDLLQKQASLAEVGKIFRNCKPVTPSDTENLIKEGLITVFDIGGATVKVESVTGDIVTLDLDKKEIFPLLVKKVFDSDTNATSIYLLY